MNAPWTTCDGGVDLIVPTFTALFASVGGRGDGRGDAGPVLGAVESDLG